MIFDFIIDKFFETKLVKGYPACPDCPPSDPDCTNPCGCDCNGGGPCGGCDGGASGPGGGFGGGGNFGAAPGGRVMSIEEEVGEFLAVGQLLPMENDGMTTYCPTPPPKKCKECSGSGGIYNGPGKGGKCQVTIEY
jgi:hypothetical protein